MAEPTLGARILDAAEAYANSVQEAIQMWGAGEWTSHHDEATAEELTTLRALCARADAAERLAVASSRYIATIDGQRAWTTGTDSDLSEALAAWRAITEEAQP